MRSRRYHVSWMICIVLSLSCVALAHGKDWIKIIPQATSFMGMNLEPKCSGLIPTNTQYAFWARQGSTKNLIIYLQGGGSCWNPVTCVTRPTYYPDVTDSDLYVSGIFDFSNQANPFKDWYFLYVPYCTADLHWGSGDWDYQFMPGQAVTIYHRGLDNFLSALKWAKENFPRRLEKVLLTGSSAGSMGAIGSFPWVRRVYPTAKLYVLGDAGIGVGPREMDVISRLHWNLGSPLDLPHASDPPRLSELWIGYASKFKNVRFGEYAAAWDETLTYFRDRIFTDFKLAPQESDFCLDFHELLLSDLAEKQKLPNYKSYVAAGTLHVILPRAEFYTENSAGIPFIKWLENMINDSDQWDNVSCSGDCGKPPVCPYQWGD